MSRKVLFPLLILPLTWLACRLSSAHRTYEQAEFTFSYPND